MWVIPRILCNFVLLFLDGSGNRRKHLGKVAVLALLWGVWLERDRKIFMGERKNVVLFGIGEILGISLGAPRQEFRSLLF